MFIFKKLCISIAMFVAILNVVLFFYYSSAGKIGYCMLFSILSIVLIYAVINDIIRAICNDMIKFFEKEDIK